MDITMIKNNADTLYAEMQWLAEIIDIRIKLYFQQTTEFTDIRQVPPPDLTGNPSVYAGIVNHYRFGFDERLVLLLALAPHVQPHLLDVFFTKNSGYDRNFTEFGGIVGQHHGGFLPTGETAAFIVAANDFELRFRLLTFFSAEHPFAKFNILQLNHGNTHEPVFSGALCLSSEYLSYFTMGASQKPDFNIGFPAKHLVTQADWNDLVLEEATLQEVLEIRDWIQYGDIMLNEWGLRKHIKPGYRALFYGPPGTGKTLTATLLGKETGLDVYRIDLSMVVSKYIGETEKNLSAVFNQAEHKNWILFFDEADALFGKRTQTSSSNDRHANQEVSYLLQRIEDFPGVVILATNLKANLDEAFSRRFQSMIYFPMPGPDQRKTIWEKAFSKKCTLEASVNLTEISGKYEMAGGAIVNVLRYCSLKALKRNSTTILKNDIIAGIRKEFAKDGKTVH